MAAGVTVVAGSTIESVKLAPANWFDEKSGGLTYTSVTLDGIEGRTIAGSTDVWKMTAIGDRAAGAGSVAPGRTIVVDLRVKQESGTGGIFRFRVGGSTYNPDTASTHQTFRVNLSTASVAVVTGTATVIATPVPNATVTNLGSGVYRVQIEMTTHPSSNITGAMRFGFAPDTALNSWSVAVAEIGLPTTASANWSGQDGLVFAGGKLTGTAPLAPATDAPSCLSAVFRRPTDATATERVFGFYNAAGTWAAYAEWDATERLFLTVVDPVAGTQSVQIAEGIISTNEAVVHTLEVRANGIVAYYVDGVPAPAETDSEPVEIVATAGGWGTNPLNYVLGAAPDDTAPFLGEIVRAAVGVDPAWLPPIEVHVDTAPGYVPVKGWLYGTTV